MAKKNDMISIRKFEEVFKTVRQDELKDDWNGLEITIKKNITLAEMAKFVDTVTKACFAKESGEYYPEGKDFAIRTCVIAFYTNISLPSNIEKIYEFIYKSDISNFVINRISPMQFDAIIKAIDEKVQHTAAMRAEYLNAQIRDVGNTFETLGEQFKDLLGDISKEDLTNMVGAISADGIDENKLMSALLNAKQEQTASIA